MTESECALRIRSYWLGRGYDVNVRLETIRDLGLIGTYVRSDMVNGLPRGYVDHTTKPLRAARS